MTPAELFQDGSGNFVTAFRWLVWIGCGAHGNRLPHLDLAQFLPEQVGRVFFDIDFPLKIYAVPHFHELVGVTGVAILAGEFASPIWINSPGEWHSRTGAPVK